MSNHNDIPQPTHSGIPQPARAPLTLQPFLSRKGNYEDLPVFKKAECIYGITYYFAHQYDKMTERYTNKLHTVFVEQGGIRERMTAARLEPEALLGQKGGEL